MNPLVSVIMPVYNAEKYLKSAIESILNQTFSDYEFIIINDGSTDNSENIITSFSDPRIRYHKNTQNLGLSATLNKGINFSNGKYIARMDADDISLPDRFLEQVKFLDTHPDYGIVGTLFAVKYFPKQTLEIGGVRLIENEDLKLAMRYSNIYCHGEVMIRKSLLINNKLLYNPEYTATEDYDLWRKLAPFTKFKTLPQILYIYSVHPQNVSSTKSQQMLDQSKLISEQIKKSFPLPNPSLNLMYKFWKNGRSYSDEKVEVLGQKLETYLKLNYQVFLFRLGYIFWPVSFLISPLNWFKKFFGLLPTPKQ